MVNVLRHVDSINDFTSITVKFQNQYSHSAISSKCLFHIFTRNLKFLATCSVFHSHPFHICCHPSPSLPVTSIQPYSLALSLPFSSGPASSTALCMPQPEGSACEVIWKLRASRRKPVTCTAWHGEAQGSRLHICGSRFILFFPFLSNESELLKGKTCYISSLNHTH